MTITPEQLAKLPMYARQEIKRLTADLAAAKAELNAGPEDSNTYAGRIIGIADFPGKPLGQSPRILFVTGPGRGDGDQRESIEARVDRGGVELRSNGDYRIAVEPVGSNTVRVVPISYLR